MNIKSGDVVLRSHNFHICTYGYSDMSNQQSAAVHEEVLHIHGNSMTNSVAYVLICVTMISMHGVLTYLHRSA
jgi:hypothetical protein